MRRHARELAFAVSCNSVFAPLGVEARGARAWSSHGRTLRLQPQPRRRQARPKARCRRRAQIQGQLDIGSTAIGQGEVQASALEMATVAATIADGGRRPQPTFDPSAAPARGGGTFVSSQSVAHTVRSLMIGVVREGTGTAAAIPGVTVAGKTGTAELKTASTCTPSSEPSSKEEDRAPQGKRARKAVGLRKTKRATPTPGSRPSPRPSRRGSWSACCSCKDGAGGATAAPVARQVLEAGPLSHSLTSESSFLARTQRAWRAGDPGRSVTRAGRSPIGGRSQGRRGAVSG